jgi:hypothetical protein
MIDKLTIDIHLMNQLLREVGKVKKSFMAV